MGKRVIALNICLFEYLLVVKAFSAFLNKF